jgi:hypothetical protein
MIKYRRGVIVLSLAAFFSVQVTAAPVIGVASTRGTMEIDHASIRGTANLLDGSAIRTNETSGQIQLQNGSLATLGQRTAAEVFANRIVLREGVGQISSRGGFEVGALGFRISPANNKAVARISFERSDRILVSALDSGVKVSRDGVLLAHISAGTTYYFEPDSSPSDSQVAQSAGKTSGGAGKPVIHHATRTGLSTGAKWGIVTGIAAAAAVGLGVGLSGDDASR